MMNEILAAQRQAAERGENPRSLYLSYEDGRRFGFERSGACSFAGMTVYLGRTPKEAWVKRMADSAMASARISTTMIYNEVEVVVAYTSARQGEYAQLFGHTIRIPLETFGNNRLNAEVQHIAHQEISSWLRRLFDAERPPKMEFQHPDAVQVARQSLNRDVNYYLNEAPHLPDVQWPAVTRTTEMRNDEVAQWLGDARAAEMRRDDTAHAIQYARSAATQARTAAAVAETNRRIGQITGAITTSSLSDYVRQGRIQAPDSSVWEWGLGAATVPPITDPNR